MRMMPTSEPTSMSWSMSWPGRRAPLIFASRTSTARDDNPLGRPVRRRPDARPLRRVGLQSGRRQGGAARNRADRADGGSFGDRRRLRCPLRPLREAAGVPDRRLGGGGRAGRAPVRRRIHGFVRIFALYDGGAFGRLPLRRAVLRRARDGHRPQGRAAEPVPVGGPGARLSRRRVRPSRTQPRRGMDRRRARPPRRGAVGRDHGSDPGDAAEARRPPESAPLPDRGGGADRALHHAGVRRTRPLASFHRDDRRPPVAGRRRGRGELCGVVLAARALYPAHELAAFTFVSPLVGVFAGWFVFGEAVTPGFAVAIFLVVSGVALVNWPRRR